MPDIKEERLEKESTTKKIYYYHDSENGIKQLSREIFKKEDIIIHYPRGFEGGEKYKTIRRFIFIGFKKGLPVGIIKSVNYGWGFTKTLNPFSAFFDANFDIEDIIIEKNGKTELDEANKKLYLNESNLIQLQKVFSTLNKKYKNEADYILHIQLYSFFPAKITKPKKKYIANALASSLASWGNSIDEFSDDDKNTIKDLFDKLSLTTDFLTKDALAKTKEIIDIKFIQEAIKRFDSLITIKTDGGSLEKQWQGFLKENSWIFSTIFAEPVILYQDEAYTGGKFVDNTGGKINDFLIKSNLSNNISFLEIKTHKTKLLETNPYRGDDVYSVSKELSGSINQVLNQRDLFQKEFTAFKWKANKKGKDFESFNSKCFVLIGQISELAETQKGSFELFRSNSRNVEILTFDELRSKIVALQDLMSK